MCNLTWQNHILNYINKSNLTKRVITLPPNNSSNNNAPILPPKLYSNNNNKYIYIAVGLILLYLMKL
jgi:hypothetical protein